MFFHQVVDQKQAGADLRGMVLRAQLPHALMVYGPPGAGSLPMALALTRYLLCLHKTEHDSCGQCPNCQKMDRLEHPDVHFAFPTISRGGGKKEEMTSFLPDFRDVVRQKPYASIYELLQAFGAENKQGRIKADDIRELIDTLSLKSYEGGFKVQLIWAPEFMQQAGNILLKTLEEPPAKTILILVPENYDAVLGTIKSRCQTVKLPPLPQEAIEQALLSRKVVSDEQRAQQIALLSEGNYNEALKLSQSMESDLLAPMRNWFNALATNNRIQISKTADEWHKQGREWNKNFLAYVQTMLHQAVRLQYLPQATVQVSEQERAFLSRLAAKNYRPEVYEEMSRLMNETSKAIAQNASAKMALHALSIRMVPLLRG